MTPTQTAEAPAEDAPKKEEPKYIARPKRRRPTDPREESLQFLGVALNALDAAGVSTLKETRLALSTLWGRWCRNTGLRGVQKDRAWRQVLIAFDEARQEEAQSATAPTG